MLIPNAEIFTSRITNNTASPFRRASIRIHLWYREDVSRAMSVVLDSLSSVPGVVADPAPSTRLTDFGEDSLQIEARFWTESRRSSLMSTASAARIAIVEALKAAGIQLPDPDQRVVTMAPAPHRSTKTRSPGARSKQLNEGDDMMLAKPLAAEFVGTFWLVFAGCGSAVLAAGAPDVGIGWLGVSLAFGLTVVTMAYAVGHISGCHLNPAVSIGLAAAGRFGWSSVLPYVVAQVAGGVVAAVVLYVIASGNPAFLVEGGFASNGYGAHSPGGYSLGAGAVAEAVLTMMFLFIILGATDERAPKGFAPLAIGLGLTLIHLVGIPVTNLSVNPARSTGPAFMVGGWAVAQLWLFWVAPIVGAVVGAVTYRWVGSPASSR